MPNDISIKHINDAVLIIAPDTANWIVLSSEREVEVFDFLRENNSVGDAIRQFGYDYTHNVVVQLEARRFCSRKVKSVTEEFKHMHIYLTNSCNLRCPHCYMYSGKADDNELTTAEIIKLFGDFKKAGGHNITLSGGEPTMRNDFGLLVRTAFDLKLKVRVLTNGSLWSQYLIESISPMLDSIQISIDGYSEQTNSQIRGRGHFDIALKTIDELLAKGVNLSVAITPPYQLLKQNMEEYAAFALYLSEKYKDKKLLVKFSEGLLNGREECPSKSENEEYFNLIQELRRRLHGNNFEFISFVRAIKHDVIMDNCMFGVFAIASNGDVYMCARTSDLKPVANIRDYSFENIVELSKTAIAATQINRLRPCGDCDLRFICGGGCRIDEFPELVNREVFSNIDYSKIRARECNPQMRMKFYALMVRSNPYLYRQL